MWGIAVGACHRMHGRMHDSARLKNVGGLLPSLESATVLLRTTCFHRMLQRHKCVPVQIQPSHAHTRRAACSQRRGMPCMHRLLTPTYSGAHSRPSLQQSHTPTGHTPPVSPYSSLTLQQVTLQRSHTTAVVHSSRSHIACEPLQGCASSEGCLANSASG
jgi:hypothetical protein